jgi:hypothetical protein
MALYWPKVGKRIPSNWEINLQPLGSMFEHLLMSGHQCLARINNLGPKNKLKMQKVGNKSFGS